MERIGKWEITSTEPQTIVFFFITLYKYNANLLVVLREWFWNFISCYSVCYIQPNGKYIWKGGKWGLSHKLTVHSSCKIYFNKTSLLCKNLISMLHKNNWKSTTLICNYFMLHNIPKEIYLLNMRLVEILFTLFILM